MIIDFNSRTRMFINWLDKDNRYFMIQKFPGKLFLYLYFFEINFAWESNNKGKKMTILFTIIATLVVLRLCAGKQDDTDKSVFNRSGLRLYTDQKTKLQYIGAGWNGQLIPRLDENGKHMKGE